MEQEEPKQEEKEVKEKEVKEKEVKEEPKFKLRCERCGSGFTYFRHRTNEIVCRQCGHIEKKK